MSEKIKVTIDNIQIEVDPGTTILEAARKIGGDIVPPAMCYYSKLKESGGKCRTCIVKVAQGSAKDPRPMPKLVASCRTTVMDGMVVENITSPEVVQARKGVVELMLLNHPLDCPVCDQAGECTLQDLTFEHGASKTRNEFERNTFNQQDFGKYISLNTNRCILCYRCVFGAQQLTDKRVHGVIYRGDHSEISTYVAGVVENEFSGNIIDMCPVGALTDKTFRFKNRVWFTKPVLASCKCDKCSGKVTLWYKGEDIIRVTGRKDQYGELEDFICNTCRFEKRSITDWKIEGPAKVDKLSVQSLNHYDQPKVVPVFNKKVL